MKPFRIKVYDMWKHSYNKTNEMHLLLVFTFGIELYMFQTGLLSIIRSLALYTQQYMQVMLTAC